MVGIGHYKERTTTKINVEGLTDVDWTNEIGRVAQTEGGGFSNKRTNLLEIATMHTCVSQHERDKKVLRLAPSNKDFSEQYAVLKANRHFITRLI